MQQQETKRVFKVIAPMDKKDGGKWWLRCGSGYLNRDNSINLYIDALPATANKDGTALTLQVRELTEQDLRERDERRQSSYSARGTLGRSFEGRGDPGGGGSSVTALPGDPFRATREQLPMPGGAPASTTNGDIPF